MNTIYSDELKSLLRQVDFAMMPKNGDRITLEGIWFELQQDTLTVVATDGKRLATAKTILSANSIPSIPTRGLLARDTYKALSSKLSKAIDCQFVSDGNGTFAIQTDSQLFNLDTTTDYFNWRGVFPEDESKLMISSIEKEPIYDIMEAMISRQKGVRQRATQLKITEKLVEITGWIGQSGLEVKARVDVYDKALNYRPLTIGINATYLLDALSCIGGKYANFYFEDALRPFLLRGCNPDQENLIMPMRI